VFLHGAGERGTDMNVLRRYGVSKVFGADPDYRGVRVVTLCPQCPDHDIWSNHTFTVYQLIRYTMEQYHVDPQRVTITGLSMGGFGTWELTCRYPELFAAAAPVCGGGMSWRADALKRIPFRVYHGDQDTTVPIEYSMMMVKAINRVGGHAELTVFPGVNHDAWTPAYEQTDLVEWLAAQKKC
ncbi:MAG: prolyl oligopeptidase family serine peptidase, partial [Clostridia bacterium]|nr:prolyl oligopeptidase family serine peptidase [Clostridia bacterium]